MSAETLELTSNPPDVDDEFAAVACANCGQAFRLRNHQPAPCPRCGTVAGWPEASDALPNTEERPMGGNPANPLVNVLSDTKAEGLQPEHANAQTAVKEEEAAAVAVQAQNAVQIYENQLGILKRDNEQLVADNRKGVMLVKSWHDALGIALGDDVEATVKALRSDLDAANARVGQLQIALGIGPTDDAEHAAGKLKARNRLADVDPTSTLPAYGHLLLMTALARISPLLMGSYKNTPTSVTTPEGDLWVSRIEETEDEDGTPMRLVVVRHEPGAYQYQEARATKLRLDSLMADATRAKTMAEKRVAVHGESSDSDVRDQVKQDLVDARRRIGETEDALAEVVPLTEEPEPKEWRFNADLEGYALKGDA